MLVWIFSLLYALSHEMKYIYERVHKFLKSSKLQSALLWSAHFHIYGELAYRIIAIKPGLNVYFYVLTIIKADMIFCHLTLKSSYSMLIRRKGCNDNARKINSVLNGDRMKQVQAVSTTITTITIIPGNDLAKIYFKNSLYLKMNLFPKTL